MSADSTGKGEATNKDAMTAASMSGFGILKADCMVFSRVRKLCARLSPGKVLNEDVAGRMPATSMGSQSETGM
ncbi:MAG: hypothetical protein ABL878_00135 [Burkholderiales bacterium]